jgi:hypothetical protein
MSPLMADMAEQERSGEWVWMNEIGVGQAMQENFGGEFRWERKNKTVWRRN